MNLSAYLATDDPHSGRRIAEEGAALARQFGIAAWAAPLAGNAASACLMIGDLRRIFELFDEFDAGAAHPQAEGLAAWAAAAAVRSSPRRLAAELANRLEEAQSRCVLGRAGSGQRLFEPVRQLGGQPSR